MQIVRVNFTMFMVLMRIVTKEPTDREWNF